VDTIPGLKELQARKRDLLQESELNREILRVELGQVRYRAEQVQHGYGWAQNIWNWGAPVAAFLLARKFKKSTGAFAKGSMLITALRTGWKAWELFRANRSKPHPRS
jgi:hypothetical protein